MQDKNAKSLFEKYQSGNCTPEEQALIENYILSYEDPGFQLNEAELIQAIQKLSDRVLLPVRVQTSKRLWPQLLTAAAACIAFIITIYFFDYFPGNRKKEMSVYANDIAPGSNKAVLILADGRKINLNDVKTGNISTQKNVQVNKTKEGQLEYRTVAQNHHHSFKNKNEQIAYNSIQIPKGGQYMVCLPDGSKVWLNSASTLKFPTAFNDVTRKVELSGEAYFEVSKDKLHPFIVKSLTQQIKVLGTHFNISTYQDEAFVKTTLLEGSVEVIPAIKNSNKETQETFLTPGQQSMLTNGKITVSKANLQDAVAWKNGYFILNHDTFREIMSKISRWYNVDVVYQCNPDRIHIGGIVSRSVNISTVLKLMGETGQVHFKIEGRRITVIE